jgi:type III secretion system YscD/HrpQ family protein
VSALLKIVQGPNAGAEIALPDGIEITLGKADTCDIVLADPTLPDAPATLSATPGGVLLDGTPLEPYHVHLLGSTALAVGPSDTAWQPLVFPAPEAPAPAEPEPAPSTGSAGVPPAEPPAPSPTPSPSPSKPRRSFLIPLAVLLVLLVLLVLFLSLCTRTRAPTPDPAAAQAAHQQQLSDFATRYNLTLDTAASRPSFTGNFATRAERLEATARLYETFPGAALDLTDDESLRTAVSDALLVLGETTLSVDTVTDRTATLTGTTDTPATLSSAIDAIRSDVPRITDVIASAVTFRSPGTPTPAAAADPDVTSPAARRRAARAAASDTPTLPVCGILSTPYPCLVLRDGTRVFPGATLGGSVVQSITPDSVVLATTNGTFTWKP